MVLLLVQGGPYPHNVSQAARILDRDLRLASISKIDDCGRRVDVHALRHSFGTLMSMGGVSPRTAQAAMRHSSIDLTMNIYTVPRLLDVAGALEALPSLALNADVPSQELATGTAGTGSPLVPELVPESALPTPLGSMELPRIA